MAIVKWETLLRLVQPTVRNAPRQAMVNEIQEAARTFCERSLFWQETLDTLLFPEGVATAEIDVPAGAIVTKVISFKLEGAEQVPDLQYTADEYSITLASPPLKSVSGVVVVALRPAMSSEGLPEAIMEQWGSAIATGALASLKFMTGSEWFDAAGAKINDERFEQAIATAKRRRLVGLAPKNLQVAPRRLW